MSVKPLKGIQKFIEDQAKKLKIEVDPRHVEGGLLLQYGRTGHLGSREINKEIRITAGAYQLAGGRDSMEDNAISYGL